MRGNRYWFSLWRGARFTLEWEVTGVLARDPGGDHGRRSERIRVDQRDVACRRTGTASTKLPPEGWWASSSGYLAAVWAAVYGVVALVWTVTGSGFPFGDNDPNELSLLSRLHEELGAPLFAVVLLVTAVTVLAMAGHHAMRLRGPGRLPLLGFGWAVAAALLVVIPDERLLTLAGYTPMLVLAVPFGGLPVDYSTVFTWPLLTRCGAWLAGCCWPGRCWPGSSAPPAPARPAAAASSRRAGPRPRPRPAGAAGRRTWPPRFRCRTR